MIYRHYTHKIDFGRWIATFNFYQTLKHSHMGFQIKKRRRVSYAITQHLFSLCGLYCHNKL